MKVILLLYGLASVDAAFNYIYTYDYAGSILTYDVSDAGFTVAANLGAPQYEAYTYSVNPASITYKDRFAFSLDGSLSLRSCWSNTFIQTDLYIQFSTQNATVLSNNFTTQSLIAVPAAHSILDIQFGSNCSNKLMATQDTSTSQFYLHYYEGLAQITTIPMGPGTVFKEMIVGHGKVYVRMNSHILQYMEDSTLTNVRSLSISSPSMVLTDDGTLIYSIGSWYYVKNPNDIAVLDAMIPEVATIRAMAPLANGRILTLTSTQIIEKSAVPILATDSSISVPNSLKQYQIETFFSGQVLVAYHKTLKFFDLYQIYTTPTPNIALPVPPSPVTPSPVPPSTSSSTSSISPTKYNLWKPILLSLTNSRLTFKALEPVSLLLDQFKLYKYHRETYCPFVRIFIHEVDYIGQMIHKAFPQQSQFNWKALQNTNKQYLLTSRVAQQSDPDILYFGEASQQLLVQNLLTVLMVFLMLKILQLAASFLPKGTALVRYIQRQLTHQISGYAFLVSLVESCITLGTFFGFSQFSNFHSFSWTNKIFLILCIAVFFVLLAYSLAFYPITSKYNRPRAKMMLYFTKDSRASFALHTYVTCGNRMIFPFAHSFLFYDYHLQILTLIGLSAFNTIVLLYFRNSFFSKKLFVVYLSSSIVSLAINSFLYVDSKPDTAPVIELIIKYLIIALLSLVVIKNCFSLTGVILAIREDWMLRKLPVQGIRQLRSSKNSINLALEKNKNKGIQQQSVYYIPVKPIKSANSPPTTAATQQFGLQKCNKQDKGRKLLGKAKQAKKIKKDKQESKRHMPIRQVQAMNVFVLESNDERNSARTPQKLPNCQKWGWDMQ